MSNNSRRGLTWDEAVIEEHNKERGTRQKILEPPTPYAYTSDHEDELEDEEDTEDVRGAEKPMLKDPKPVEIKDSLAELNAKLEYHKHLAEENPSGLVAGRKDEKKTFSDRRAEHYNEFKVIQALRAKKGGVLDDDEGSEDDEEGQGKNDDPAQSESDRMETS